MKKDPGSPDRDLGSVRNLAYLALSETTKIPEQAGYVRCVACVITRGVSFIRVCSRRLVVPTQDIDFKARRVLFRAERGCVQQKARKRSGINVESQKSLHVHGDFVVFDVLRMF